MLSNLAKADECFGRKSPWDSIYKMEALLAKCGKDAAGISKMEWCLAMTNDAVANKLMTSGKLSHQQLTGKHRGGTASKGFLDLLLFVREVRIYCLGNVLDASTLPQAAKQTLRSVLESPLGYRKATGQPYLEKGVVVHQKNTDISWMSTLGAAGREFFNFMEVRMTSPLSFVDMITLTYVCICTYPTCEPEIYSSYKDFRSC